MTRPLSILDLTPIAAGSSSRQALQDAVDLAVLADRLGFHRIWYAEHHNTEGLASAAPEILIAHIAAKTTHLRLGSGGVMLPNHAPCGSSKPSACWRRSIRGASTWASAAPPAPIRSPPTPCAARARR